MFLKGKTLHLFEQCTGENVAIDAFHGNRIKLENNLNGNQLIFTAFFLMLNAEVEYFS